MSLIDKFKAMVEGTRFFILCEDLRRYVEKNYDPEADRGTVSAKEQKTIEGLFFASYDELIAGRAEETDGQNNACLTDTELSRKAGINKTVLTKLRAHSMVPSKKTLIRLCAAAELDLNDTEWLLQSAGYSFSNASMGELAMKFFIQYQLYDLKLIDNAMDSLGYKIK